MPRSEEDHLRRLAVIHLHGGRPAFVKALADIRASRIHRKHRELFKEVVSDAKGFPDGVRDPDVRATLRHIAKQRLLMRRYMRSTAVASVDGHAVLY